ncbi:MAG: hypothetical protein FJZ97_14255, partial [Chloroflexi bacterium]|nr:hypothetical protein [Chloroflexota bacterium]
MQLLPVLASMLVGVSAGLILVAGIELVRARRARESAGDRRTISLGLRAVLDLVALPRGIEERWASQDLERRLRYAGLTLDGRAFVAARWLVLRLGLLLAV